MMNNEYITESYLIHTFGRELVEVYKKLFGESEYVNFNSRFCGYYDDVEEYTKHSYSVNYLPLYEIQPVPSYTKYVETEFAENFYYDAKSKALFRRGPVEQLEHPWTQNFNFNL